MICPNHIIARYPCRTDARSYEDACSVLGHARSISQATSLTDTTAFHRNDAFYFKTSTDDDWNQVVIAEPGSEPQFTWDSATHGEYTLADGTVAVRDDGLPFVVASKPMTKATTYADRRDLVATWYKFSKTSNPNDPPYMLKPTFERNYPRTALTVDDILAREMKMQPHK